MQCLFGVWPGRWQGRSFIDGQPVSITNCQQAIGHGIAMVPEDRKKDGIVPVMAVGKNITGGAQPVHRRDERLWTTPPSSTVLSSPFSD